VSSDYACRKLYEALDCLVADGPIQDRLRGAALHLVNINSEELPEETQRDFNEVKQELSMVLANSLSNEESIRIARKLLSLYRYMSGALR
jgi:flagellin-specific chaperone FliS